MADAKKLRDATNRFMAERFQTEMGQRVFVERHKTQNDERAAMLRDVLRDVGRDLQEMDAGTRGLDYLGSFSVHVYASHVLGSMVFQTLTAPDKCTYDIADAALRELNGSVMEDFGHKRQTRRSGAS